jgi:GH25 family lysozyme M1 (1,4-beta-N-acetylmuramidase)
MATLQPLWAPSKTDKRILGNDLSRHNGPVVFELWELAEIPPEYTAIRGGVSWGYRDGFFDSYRRQLNLARRLWIPYFVLAPKERIDLQVAAWQRILAGDRGPANGRIVLDVEVYGGSWGYPSKRDYTRAVGNALSECEKKLGKVPMIYSRPEFVRYRMEIGGYFNDVLWWMAQYTFTGREHGGPVAKVAGIPPELVVIHQTSQRGKGALYGTTSKAIDYDRWQGTPEQWSEIWTPT